MLFGDGLGKPVKAYAADPVAHIGNTGYDSLQAAFDAATDQEQTTVVLDQNVQLETTATVSEGKNIILDMNGKTITVSDQFTGRPITNNGTLTVTGNGTIDTVSAHEAYGAVDNYGSLVIENGVYKSYTYAGGSVIKNRPNTTCEIFDGESYGSPTAVYNEGITTIHNGLYDGRSCSSCNSSVWGYTLQNHWNDKSAAKPELYFYDGHVIGVQGAFSTSAGHTEIHDGEFETVACATHNNGNSAWYALYIAGESGEVECNVYGGEFRSLTKYAAYVGNSNDGGEKLDAIAHFYGGTFTSGRSDDVIHVDEKLGGLEITGGSYYLNDHSAGDISEWLAEGYKQDHNGSVIHSHKDAAVKTEAKDVTCTEKGNREYWQCRLCGKYFSDEECTHEITYESTVINATGHTFENGTCTVCGAADPDYKPDNQTQTKPGQSGNENQTGQTGIQSKPADVPQTGDDSHPVVWGVIVLAACAAVIAVIIIRKKHK